MINMGRDRVSDYLLSSLKSYFGDEVGEKLAHLLSKTGITCFDDLTGDVPEEILELAEIDRASFMGFLDEYGPQAIIRLKRELSALSSKIGDLESQLKWAREKILRDVGTRTSRRAGLRREIEAAIGMLDALARSVKLCCEPHSSVGKERSRAYSDVLGRVIERLHKVSVDLNEVEPVLKGLENIRSLLEQSPIADDLYHLISYSVSSLSDLRRLIAEETSESKILLWENILLKSELISVLCRKRDR